MNTNYAKWVYGRQRFALLRRPAHKRIHSISAIREICGRLFVFSGVRLPPVQASDMPKDA